MKRMKSVGPLFAIVALSGLMHLWLGGRAHGNGNAWRLPLWLAALIR